MARDTEKSLEPDTLLTTHDIGSLLQMDPSSINNWVREGMLESYRTPGGHNRIRAADLLDFLYEHNMHVPGALRSAGRANLLVVDDDARERRSWTRRSSRYKEFLDVEVLSSGVAALVRVGQRRPTGIVLDLIMPEMDGIEVCRRLKAMPDLASVKVLIVSGALNAKNKAKALEAGADAALAKPADIKEVLGLLNIDTRARSAL